MAKKILGLDIGASAVKAVCVTRGIKGQYRVIDAAAIVINESDGYENGVGAALEKLFANKNFQDCTCATALPVRNMSFRTINLPFRDEKKIRQTILFELEPLIQCPVEEVVVEFKIRHFAMKGTSSVSNAPFGVEVFAAIATKSFVRDWTELISRKVMNSINSSPRTDGGAVMNFNSIDVATVPVASRLIHKNLTGPVDMLLDIGAKDTAAVFIRDGQIVQIRHYDFGGDLLTEAIAGDLRVGIEEGERRKRAGEILKDKGEITRTCQKFYGDLKNTISFLIWQDILPAFPASVLVTGGGALYKPVVEGLSQDLSVPVAWVDITASGDIQIEANLKKTWESAVMNEALALAVRAMSALPVPTRVLHGIGLERARKDLGFNFKTHEHSTYARYGQFKPDLKWGAVFGALVIFLLGADFILGYHYESRQLQNLKNEIALEFKKIAPETTRIVDPVQQIRTKIAESRRMNLGLGYGNSSATALDMLKDISALVPTSAEYLINSLDFDSGAIVIKGQAKNFDAIETIKKELAKSKLFETITVGATNLAKQGGKVDFDLKITVKR